MLAAAPMEVAAGTAEVVEATRERGVDVETDMVLRYLALELGLGLGLGFAMVLAMVPATEVVMEVVMGVGVGVTELTRTRVLVTVVVAVEVMVSSAATNGAATRQREATMVVNFILRIDSKVDINTEEGAKRLNWI